MLESFCLGFHDERQKFNKIIMRNYFHILIPLFRYNFKAIYKLLELLKGLGVAC